jgi:hypothetical protein
LTPQVKGQANVCTHPLGQVGIDLLHCGAVLGISREQLRLVGYPHGKLAVGAGVPIRVLPQEARRYIEQTLISIIMEGEVARLAPGPGSHASHNVLPGNKHIVNKRL